MSFHAIIIGGGPAGAVVGISLARCGWRVDLFEQHRFPRDKVCGECTSALGIGVLRRLNLADRIVAAGAVRLERAIAYADDGQRVELPLHQPMWGISRLALDDLLLRSAVEAGVIVHQPARCEKIEPGDKPSIVFRDLQTNRTESLAADWVLLADGKGALLEKRPRPTGDFGIKAHFTDVAGPRDAIELFGVQGSYGGLAPIEGNRWNAAFSVSAQTLERYGGDASAAFAQICRENPVLKHRMTGARRAGSWLISPLPRFAIAHAWPRGVIPLGNAAVALEPIGGEGIGVALRSAELATEFLADPRGPARAEAQSLSNLRQSFAHLWRLRRAACRLAALGISTPALSGPALELLAGNERLSQTLLRWVGKEAQV